MSIENRPEIVTDSGCLIRREPGHIEDFQFTVAPLDVNFVDENGNIQSFEDTSLSPVEFYNKMRQSKELPKTSGGIFNKLVNIYDANINMGKSILSIHVTDKHSAVFKNAIKAKEEVESRYSQIFNKKKPHLFIGLIDSKLFSVPAGFLVEQAATLANEGYPLEEINRIIVETIPKTEVYVALNNFENVVKGGRLTTNLTKEELLKKAIGFVGDKFNVKPFITMVDGELKLLRGCLRRTERSSHEELIKKIENSGGNLVKLAVIHTNYLKGALALKEKLSHLYSGEIGVFEAGPVLGVHAGEGGLGVAFQKA